MTAREMPAGRSLDAEVAEKVMGLRRDGDFAYSREARFRSAAGNAMRAPHYSTDIAAAWEVVQKLSGFDGDRERPWWSVAVFHAQENQVMAVIYANEPGWRIDDTDERIAEGHGWTAPEAICRAALASLERAR